ncbi:MAG: HAD family phosphatase [Clostridiales bacterium]|nr:HAD family phosphatase [Clostridiales bacterium]
MKKYKNIVFDVGGVLSGYKFEKVMHEKYGAEEGRTGKLVKQMGSDKIWNEFDYENYNFYEVVELFAEKYKDDADFIREIFSHMAEYADPYYDVWDLVHELKSVGYKIYLLSNYSSVTFQWQLGDGYFLKDVDGYLFSHEIHEIKPHPIIYQKFFEKNSLNPSECLFFDDRPDNVEGAKGEGMDAIRVESKDFLIGKLKELIEVAKTTE